MQARDEGGAHSSAAPLVRRAHRELHLEVGLEVKALWVRTLR
jgi:hypothetical protein